MIKGIKNIYFWFTVFLILSFVYPVHSKDIVVQSSVDRIKIGLNEEFTLTVDISGDKANQAGEPQIPDISDFAVYTGSTGTSQNIQIINGQMNVSRSTSYTYRAVTLGKFTIPPVVLKFKGKEYRSKPIQIEVVKTAQKAQPRQRRNTYSTPGQSSESVNSENLFLRVTASKRNVYVNEPLILSFKIYTRVTVTQYGVNKLPNTAGFWVEDFDLGNQPQIYEEVYNGRKYRVAEIKRMALFPTDVGIKKIGPMEIECNIRVQSRRRSIFDSFFDDPFFGRTIRKLLSSRPVTINVKPLPEENKPASFSGLVGNFQISSFVDKTQVKTNEAIALRIEIAGSGNIKMIPTPNIELPSDFEQYPPKVSQKVSKSEQGISGSKTFEYVLVPRHPGLQKIKPIEFSYFDVKAGKYKVLRTREILVNVEKSGEEMLTFAGGRSKEDVKYLGKDIRFIQLGKPQFQKIASYFYKSFYFFILLFLPIVIIVSSIGYQKHLEKMSGNIAYARSRRANHIAMKRLSKAKKYLKEETQKEFYAEVASALTGFLGDKLNIAAAGIITDEVEALMKQKGIDAEVIQKYIQCLRMCDYQRFAPSTAKFHEMKSFYDQAKQAIISLEKII